MSPDEVDLWRTQFEEPSADELAGLWRPRPPTPWTSWLTWAQDRWPDLSTEELA